MMIPIHKLLWNISWAVISIYVGKITPEIFAKGLIVILLIYNIHKFKGRIFQWWNRITVELFGT